MQKEQFLALAEQLFDQTNQKIEERISIEENLLEEIVDGIKTEIYESGTDIVEDYELEMYSKEISMESISFDLTEIEKIIKDVLYRYFVIK
jgi:hypothetical protein